MKEITGLSNRILEINLTEKSYEVYEVPDNLTKLYLGGKGLAIKLMYDRFKPGTEALSPDNLLVIHTGAYMGTGAPCSGRFAAVSKSPQTGIISSSSCGGPFGMALKTSGWDGLILKGASDKLLWLEIDSGGVVFHSADNLKGKTTIETHEYLDEKGNGALAIGPAGENLVSYANIISGHRFFGRTGFGAVMGSKNVKAIVSKGKEYKIVSQNPEIFKKVRSKFISDINKNDYTSIDYRKRGTASIVGPSIKNMMLPVNNFRDGTHKDYKKISGEQIENDHTEGFSTCKPCSIMCGHKGDFNGRKLQVPEYETIGLLGSSLGIFDPVKIAEWNETCKKVGIDTISAGGTLAWAMEAGEDGIFKTWLKFGSPDHVNELLKDIGYGRSRGVELGRGSRWLSEKYGGSEYAMQSKGLEVAAYDPRGSIGHGLGLATANRGACHLSATIMSSQALMGFSFKHIKSGNPFQVMFFEDVYAGINSLQTCQFTAYAVIGEDPVVRLLPRFIIRFFIMIAPFVALGMLSVKHYVRLYSAITGIKMKQRQFIQAGKRIHLLERHMNCNEGIRAVDDTLPERFLREYRESDPKKRVIRLEWMIKRYYRYRGYDSNGVPKNRTLRKWKILN